MKKIVVSLLCLLVTIGIFAQGQPKPEYNSDYYSKKAKTQKILAWGCLGGGIALAVTGAALSGTYAEDAGKWMIAGGGVLIVTSIPLFTSSTKNQKKAASMKLAFGTQDVLVPEQNSFTQKKLLAIKLSFNL
ncbi:MAG TPA: hypothetical protein VFX58_15045 [Chitinophagaceae bacterium]|nr:hypothetical protein [Chitinophagaceae bacterium]